MHIFAYFKKLFSCYDAIVLEIIVLQLFGHFKQDII